MGLCLTRTIGQSFTVGDGENQVRIKLFERNGEKIRLYCEGPREVAIVRDNAGNTEPPPRVTAADSAALIADYADRIRRGETVELLAPPAPVEAHDLPTRMADIAAELRRLTNGWAFCWCKANCYDHADGHTSHTLTYYVWLSALESQHEAATLDEARAAAVAAWEGRNNE